MSRFASQIISQLVFQGVRRICLSPGSRSSPLAAAAARESRLEKLIHFDERSMAFHAYGYAKASRTPVAIITTSGSATGNLLPAVMEAFHDHVPLILLTADRPSELYGCMANQTCDQVKLFGNYVRYFAQIPAAEPNLPDAWLRAVVAEAVFQARESPAGPVHLNCQFREPFSFKEKFELQTGTTYEDAHQTISKETAQKWAERLSFYRKGIILAGAMSPSDHASIFALAEKLDWPILPDLMSGLRVDHPNAISYYTDILKLYPDLQPDCVLHLGDRLVTCPSFNPETYVMVAGHKERCDHRHLVTHRLSLCPSVFCRELLPFISSQTSWLSDWKALSHCIEKNLNIPHFSEPGIIRYLHTHLPSHFSIYFSNSMPVRDATRFFFPPDRRIFCQRGLSGIDGNIAAAIGLAEGARTPLVAVLGDQAALHDINALAQLQQSKVPIILLVINNGGGGIFSFLPIAEQKDIFETYQAGAHNWEFSKAAELFRVPYLKMTSMEELGEALGEEQTILIEFPSNREENVRVHREIDRNLKQVLEDRCFPLSLQNKS